jgi:CelD/BcsL family acetyltransferase involved in cellulose biosynthesis
MNPDNQTTHLRALWVRDEEAFLDLREDWNRLAAASPARSVFLRHEWFDAAWQWRKSDCELRLLCVHDGDGVLRGLCPLVRWVRNTPLPGTRVLEFLAVPDTQACDVLARPADLRGVAEAMAVELGRSRGEWDMLFLSRLPADSPSGSLLPAALAGNRIRTGIAPWGDNPVIPLRGEWSAFYAQRSRSLKKSNNLAANRLARAGTVELDWRRPGAGPIDPDELVERIAAVSARSWKESTGLTLDHPGPAAFIRRLTRHAREQGWLSVWLLNLNGTPVATEYQLIHEGQVHALRADFDEGLRDLGPGTYLNWKLLERLFSEGFDLYSMGPGNNPYKLKWTEEKQRLLSVTGYSPGWRGRLAGVMDAEIRPRARRAAKWLRDWRGRKGDGKS